MRATVLITHLNDERVEDAIESALAQGPRLHEVLVADGGSEAEHRSRLERMAARRSRVKIRTLPGRIAETRNRALPLLTTEIVAFLDADEVAPAGWLDELTDPIVKGDADFAGGPTRPLSTRAASRAEAYINRADERLYQDAVPRDLALLPMGNSAWRVELLRRIGGFDPRLAWGGEDYDVNLRALRSGARGVFVPEAWVHHDQSHLDSFGKVLRRASRYQFGAATAYLKNRAFSSRAASAARRVHLVHPVALLEFLMRPWSALRAYRYYRRVFPPR